MADFWENLRRDFMQLRAECAINPPVAPAGRLIAIWTAQPPPGEWELSYWDGVDGYGVTRRFEWNAQRAAARLGSGETGQKAVWFWLDRVRRDAPESHVRTQRFEGSNSTEQLFLVEILDICGLSADFCRKCEADEMAALQARVSAAPSEETSAPHGSTDAPRRELTAQEAQQARAQTVARLIRELNDIKPQMFEDESEYNKLRAQHPDFLAFKIAERRHDLKQKILAIRGSPRHIRLAQELAAAHHGRTLATIVEDWKNFKPTEFKRPK